MTCCCLLSWTLHLIGLANVWSFWSCVDITLWSLLLLRLMILLQFWEVFDLALDSSAPVWICVSFDLLGCSWVDRELSFIFMCSFFEVIIMETLSYVSPKVSLSEMVTRLSCVSQFVSLFLDWICFRIAIVIDTDVVQHIAILKGCQFWTLRPLHRITLTWDTVIYRCPCPRPSVHDELHAKGCERSIMLNKHLESWLLALLYLRRKKPGRVGTGKAKGTEGAVHHHRATISYTVHLGSSLDPRHGEIWRSFMQSWRGLRQEPTVLYIGAAGSCTFHFWSFLHFWSTSNSGENCLTLYQSPFTSQPGAM